jgi:hypothetical protein
MGTIYSVACTNCKVTRDLDKFYNHGVGVRDRADALEHAEEIEKNSFRPALLVSFMAKHAGHECVFFDEHSRCARSYDPRYRYENGYVGDFDFWQIGPEE